MGYAGQVLDSATKAYTLGNGHRLYNPVLRRFHSYDGLSPFRLGGLNGYAYCSGDPVNHSDPSGLAKTGLTKRLKELGLPKPLLRDYLKPLGRPENFKQRRTIYKRQDDSFEAYEFFGAMKIYSKRQGTTHQSMFDGEFFVKGDIYIPKSSPVIDQPLLDKGFQLERYDYNTHLDEVIASLAATPAPQSGSSSTTGNFYAPPPVSTNKRIRNPQGSH